MGATIEPPLDVAERVAAAVADWRERHARADAVVRRVRQVVRWGALPVALVALVLVPDLRRSAVVLPGLLWALAQVCLVGRSRTLPFASVTRVVSASAVIALPIGVAGAVLAWVAGWGPTDARASVWIAGPLEETLKLAPIALFAVLARNRFRRSTAVDLALVGAASGAGFQLVEDVIRRAVSDPDGGGLFAQLFRALAAYQPADYGPLQWQPGAAVYAGVTFPSHLVLTGLVGAAIGIAWHARARFGAAIWIVPVAAWAWATLDHVGFNAAVASDPSLPAALDLLHRALGSGAGSRWAFAVGLVVAVLVDTDHRRRQRLPSPIASVGRPITPDEPLLTATWRIVVDDARILYEAARRGPAWFLPSAAFVRQRRELAAGLATAGGGPRRDAPPEDQLARAAPRIAALLGGAAAVLLIVAAGHLATDVDPGGDVAYLANLLAALGDWWGSLPLWQQLALPFAAAALLALAGMGFWPALGIAGGLATLLDVAPTLADLVEDPRGTTRRLVDEASPSQIAAWIALLALQRVLPGAAGAVVGRRGRRALDDARAGRRGPSRPAATDLAFPDRVVRRKYAKHAADFDLPPNYNATNAAALDRRLRQLVDAPDTTFVAGTYRGQPAHFFVDAARPRPRMVMTHPDGTLWSFWRLNADQATNVLGRGSL